MISEWKKIIWPIIIGFTLQFLIMVGGFYASHSVLQNEVDNMKITLSEAKVLVLKERINNFDKNLTTVTADIRDLDKKLDDIIILILQNK
jgi:hypothetical protein